MNEKQNNTTKDFSIRLKAERLYPGDESRINAFIEGYLMAEEDAESRYEYIRRTERKEAREEMKEALIKFSLESALCDSLDTLLKDGDEIRIDIRELFSEDWSAVGRIYYDEEERSFKISSRNKDIDGLKIESAYIEGICDCDFYKIN